MAKCYKLSKFYHGLTESRSIAPRTEQNKNKKNVAYKNATSLYNKMLAISFKGYNSIVDEGNKKWIKIYDTSNLFIKGVKYDKWYELFKDKSKSQSEETISEGLNGDDEDLSNMPPLERKDKKTKIRARKNYG